MAVDLGTDIGSYPDYDPLGTLVSGNVGLCQRVARRLTNVRGAWSWAPNDCTDLRSLLNEVLTSDRRSEMKILIERETLREEGVLSANADITISSPISSQGQVVTIHLSGATSNGPFQFVLSLSAVTIAILKAG